MTTANSQKAFPGNHEDFDFSEKMTSIRIIEILLKKPGLWFDLVINGKINKCLLLLFLVSMACYLGYSIIVGSYSGNTQWLASPVKIISGTGVSVLLCYPSLYIFACLSGANINPLKAMALFASGMALTAILLIGFAPVAFVFTFAIKSTFFMGVVHFFAWGVSMYFGIRHINNGLQQMEGHSPNLIRIWGLILIITMLQMTVTLRPILGESEQFISNEKRFFVEHWIENIPSEEQPGGTVN